MASDFPPILPLWLKSYLLDTDDLDNGQHGAYLMLLFAAWRNPKGRLKDDDDSLRRKARCTVDEWARVREAVLDYFYSKGGYLYQDKLTKELAKSKRWLEQKSEAGKKSGESRRNKQPLNERSNERSNNLGIFESKEGEIEETGRSISEPDSGNNGDNVKPDKLPSGLTGRIFDYWRQRMNHPDAKLSDKRRRRIAQAWRNGFSEDDMKLAIDGCTRSPHHMGENDRARRYDDLELILRDVEHVEQFLGYEAQDAGKAQQVQEANERYQRRLEASKQRADLEHQGHD